MIQRRAPPKRRDCSSVSSSALWATSFAALTASVFAFGVSLVLVKGIDATVGFCLEPQAEKEGLDRAIHGEVGFDFGPSLEVPAAHGEWLAAHVAGATARLEPEHGHLSLALSSYGEILDDLVARDR